MADGFRSVHSQRDKLPLSLDGDGDGSSSDDEAAADEEVFAIQGQDEDDEDDEEDDEDDEGDDDDEEDKAELNGFAAKLAKQARFMRQRAGGAALESDEEGGEDAEEGVEGGGEEGAGAGGAAAWGRRKQAYYSADNVDFEVLHLGCRCCDRRCLVTPTSMLSCGYALDCSQQAAVCCGSVMQLQSSDEEAPAEEEAEVRRLQRRAAARLRPEDFELGEDEEDIDDGGRGSGKGGAAATVAGSEQSLQDVLYTLERTGAAVKSANGGGAPKLATASERVEKDPTLLTEQERMEVVMSDAPELVGLLGELRESLDELRTRVQPLLERVRSGEHATAGGLGYLEAKRLLLLAYCQCIVFYLLLKSEGRSVRDHPVISRLVELRLFLEKTRPIDKRLQYQVERLLQAAKVEDGQGATRPTAEDDELQFRPHPDLLVSKIDQAATEENGGVYKPPMLASAMMGDEDGPGRARDRRAQTRMERDRRRAARSSYVQELAEELEGRPEEVRPLVGAEDRQRQRELDRLQQRAEAEVDMFARVPLSREERRRLKALKRPSSGLAGMMDDFNEDVAGLVGMDDDASAGTASGPPRDLLRPRRLSEAIAEAGRPSKKAKALSGDADLPVREDLGLRRRHAEVQALRRGSGAGGREDDALEDDNGEGNDGGRDSGDDGEDEFYAAAKERRAANIAAKAAKYGRGEPAMITPAEDSEVDGKRNISYQIEKNRGLTPHRKKLTKNPRKKYKLAHAKAVVRRGGQVREARPQRAPYGGEATGIKSGLSRSIRMR
eukprot:SM000057S18380  [mRNA]  locus=s57:229161:234186:- [translate_table: standard]